jgi:hypothetical protein
MLLFFSISPRVTAAVAAIASVAAALLAAIASYSVARVRLRELRLAYDQKLHESYLATARTYTNSIYVPLSILLTHLSTAFSAFRNNFGPDQAPPQGAATSFQTTVEDFLDGIAALTEKGADAFLTTALEDALISFTTFLRASLIAEEPLVRLVFEYRIGFVGVSAGVGHETSGRPAGRAFRLTQFGIALPGIRASMRADRLLAAPITSPEFERRIVEDLAQLKTQIKEVTLGAYGAPQ